MKINVKRNNNDQQFSYPKTKSKFYLENKHFKENKKKMIYNFLSNKHEFILVLMNFSSL